MCRGKVTFGYVVDEILKYANDRDTDLIVIGTHEQSAIGKILLGSVAERVIEKAHCPTLVMNPYR